ncbi:glycosyltransferase [candidate division WWE3 bacterium]|uniref:Glycosyltransferase n=1 Tax=candidate division WWE3 bacterium TaxID=2053526 RepID=A0A955RNY4_UNCKA|nr:glycosyltransferase [candidate division WWE3 bacterium]
MPDISVQIVNYHSIEEVKTLLPQVVKDLSSSHLRFEINILDNASGEDLSELERNYPNLVHTYYSDENVGFGRGHNQLAKHSHGEFILIMNPDITFVTEACIQNLYNILKMDDQISASAPRLLNPDHSDQIDHTVPWKNERTLHPLDLFNYKKTHEQSPAASIPGAFALIRKSIFDELSGFDPNIFFYFEEVDLFFRMRSNGYSLRYAGNQCVIHSTSFSQTKFGYYQTSLKYILNKHFPHSWWSKIFLFAVFHLPVYSLMQKLTWEDHIQEDLAKNN